MLKDIYNLMNSYLKVLKNELNKYFLLSFEKCIFSRYFTLIKKKPLA